MSCWRFSARIRFDVTNRVNYATPPSAYFLAIKKALIAESHSITT